MNFSTLKRIGELEKKVEEYAKKVDNLSELVARSEALLAQKLEERRTLTLPKNNAGYRQAT